MELRNTLQTRLGTELPATLIFDFPSVAALAGYLAAHLSPVDGSGGAMQADDAARTEGLSMAAALAEVQGIVEDMLGAEVPPDQPLMEAGLDSLGERPCGGRALLCPVCSSHKADASP